jgi:hypothetical protein
VSETGKPERPSLTAGQRLAIAVLGLGSLVPLLGARLLEPSPQGYGTHRQLGLPPCTSVVLFGRRCPTCGMTTSWAHVVRGEFIEALRANVGGTLLAILDLVAALWLLSSAARGRWVGWMPSSTMVAWVATVVVIVTLCDWAVRLIGG